MFLPPWIWRIVRSRRTKVALVWLPFLLLAGVAAFYGIANWKGERDVKRHLEWLRAEGYVTSMEEYYPPAEDPEQDVLQHPAMVDELGRGYEDRLKGLNAEKYGKRFKGLAVRVRRLRRDLGEREDVRRYFDPARHADEADAARELLDELEPERERLAAIGDAMRRRNMAWQVEWVEAGSGRFPAVRDMTSIRNLWDLAEQMGAFHLAASEADRAAPMVDLQLGLARHLYAARPTVISSMVGRICFQSGEALIREGICRRTWTDEHLTSFNQQLERLDPQRAAVEGIIGELAYEEFKYPYVRRMLEKRRVDILEGWEPDFGQVARRMRGLWWTVRPPGLTLSELTASSKGLISHGLLDDGSPRKRFARHDYVDFRRRETAAPWGILSEPGLSGMEESAADHLHWILLHTMASNALAAEARLVLLRTGIALERYRLRYGKHPENLAALVPEFLPEVLLDPYDLQSLRYRVQADGSPWVWSVGLNGTDDGGLPHQNPEKGDEIWITSPIPGFTEADHRR